MGREKPLIRHRAFFGTRDCFDHPAAPAADDCVGDASCSDRAAGSRAVGFALPRKPTSFRRWLRADEAVATIDAMGSTFVFRMRAYAAAHFDLDEHIEITWPDQTAYLQSEYTGGKTGRAYAVTIYGQVFGEAASLEAAQLHLSASIGNALPLVALAANAAIDSPLAVAVFGLDLTEPQELIWYSAPHASEFFPPGLRKIHPDATLKLMTAIGTHPQTDLLQRAAESYRNALANWFPERLLMAGEFAYIATETLSRFLIESRAAEKHITPTNLARLENAPSKDALRARYIRDEIFADDTGAYEAIKAASDGFEHGYMAVQDVRGLMQPVLERAMGLVRRALIEATGVEARAKQILLGDEYSKPRALVPPIHVITGQLARTDQAKPAPPDLARLELDLPHPEMMVKEQADGRVDFEFKTDVKAINVPENVELRGVRPGMRAAHVKPPPADQPESDEAGGTDADRP